MADRGLLARGDRILTVDTGFDLVIVGSGVAGLTAALTAAEKVRVAVVTQGRLQDGCTGLAQGGVAAALAADDSPALHFADTVAVGHGLCDEAAVRILVQEGPARVRDLIDWGVHFDGAHGADGVPTPALEAAHSRARVVHADGDATGRAIEAALITRLRLSSVTVFEHTRLLEVIQVQGGCVGVLVRDERRLEARIVAAPSVVIASGGAGALWRSTTNPLSAVGDGIAVAYEAGAEVASMEFMQFHPTVFTTVHGSGFLITEAIRGEGATIVDSDHRRFVFDSDPRGELAPRDVVASAIWAELGRTNDSHVFLDCTRIGDRVVDRFPTVAATCADHGIDITRDLIPIAPAAHYLIGGIRTDLDGSTTLPGLYACGEAASTGVHGANRLASNSLLEGLVFGRRASLAAVCNAEHRAMRPLGKGDVAAVSARVGASDTAPDGRLGRAFERLRDAMWEGAGLVREASGLARVGAVIDETIALCNTYPASGVTRFRNAAVSARLVADAAIQRTESRGAHRRSDFVNTSERWHGIQVMHIEEGTRLGYCA